MARTLPSHLDDIDAELATLPKESVVEREILAAIFDTELRSSLTGPTDPHDFLGEGDDA